MSSGARLRAAYPQAIDCSTGRPDVSLLPLEVLRRAWKSVVSSTTSSDLQYAGPEAAEPLTQVLTPLLERDGVAATGKDLVVGSSAQQLMVLCLDIVARTWGTDRVIVAVEEPGYPTIVDAYERAGARLVGIAVDEQGAIPESLDHALAAGARMVVFTPRAHNPTGASWTPKRVSDLADVLASRPDSLVVEDDQFAGIATTRPGSLFNDERIAERVVYIRSFSKSIGPDLRMAVAVARPRQRALLAEAKGYADGWTSRLLQRTLAAMLADRELAEVLDRARDTYRKRRESAAEALNAVLSRHGGGTWCGPDGVNLWVHLPPGVDSADVVERAAAVGVLVAPGEPFHIRPGHGDVVRLNAGSVPTEKAAQAGKMLAEAILSTESEGPGLIHV